MMTEKSGLSATFCVLLIVYLATSFYRLFFYQWSFLTTFFQGWKMFYNLCATHDFSILFCYILRLLLFAIILIFRVSYYFLISLFWRREKLNVFFSIFNALVKLVYHLKKLKRWRKLIRRSVYSKNIKIYIFFIYFRAEQSAKNNFLLEKKMILLCCSCHECCTKSCLQLLLFLSLMKLLSRNSILLFLSLNCNCFSSISINRTWYSSNR